MSEINQVCFLLFYSDLCWALSPSVCLCVVVSELYPANASMRSRALCVWWYQSYIRLFPLELDSDSNNERNQSSLFLALL
jgi:hypothetical protein